MPTGPEIREMFLTYFEKQGHRRVHSSSLVPANDPTLLFTNAGMNQFKDVFLGVEKRDYVRATTAQKCVRAGGKHNDLENVGFTHRHHTFFEMLGNFSFGDYFKADAIRFAWELITAKEWFGIEKNKLYATIFQGDGAVPRDEEAEKYWLEVGVPKERIFAMGMKDNFWAMGDTGPCGPCSELHYDMGAAASGEGHTDCKFPCDCGRYVEIWNLVFMQFDRDPSGQLAPLPAPCVDTGMGLERLAAVLQGKISNYETDLFTPLMKRAAELTGVDYAKEMKAESGARGAASLRVIADHARAVTFLISDGVLPSNEGRGYVLRKILRRGIRHGRLLGQDKPFMHQMVLAVRDLYKDAYPELMESAERVARVVETEEARFANTLSLGLAKLDDLIGQTQTAGGALPGGECFKLYDTFGLPLDFMTDAARDAGIEFDMEGFHRAMEQQRERARASWKGAAKAAASPVYREISKTLFEGYHQLRSRGCEVLAIVKDGLTVRELRAGEAGEVVLDFTPFYADAGGQVGDVGWFYDSAQNVIARVTGCVMPVQGVRSHKVEARQPLAIGMKIEAAVEGEVRAAIMRNHTATHLLHAALREVLGPHVKQAGSLVDPRHLRFDFSHFTAVADEELQDIEDLVNKEVLKNEDVEVINDVPIDVAVNEYKAMALFGEKYGDRVRVVKIGDFSTELCGGTHTEATGEIGLVKLLHESSVSSGVRRVEALSGEGSLRHFRMDHALESAARNLGIVSGTGEGPAAEALRREFEAREEQIRRLQRELEQMRMKSASASVSAAAEQVQEVNGIRLLAQRVPDNTTRDQMRTLVDHLRTKLGSGVVVLGTVVQDEEDKKVALICGVTKDLSGRIPAGKLVGAIAAKVGGKGGGRPDLAEAGGKDVAALDPALREAAAALRSLLG
jgi:alanyl-tRNA synthetase